MSRVVVIGAGAMGLAAAYHALKLGHEVTVLEAAPEPGGMAAHFNLAGLSIERYYHFVCRADQATFDLRLSSNMRSWQAVLARSCCLYSSCFGFGIDRSF